MPKRQSGRNIYIDQDNFEYGLYALKDTTKAPFGSARIMRNMTLTGDHNIAPRPGTELLGTENTTGYPINGLYNFRKSFDENELLVKAYDDELEVYSKNHPSAGWFRLKDGFTAAQEFGFVTSLVNEDNEDYLVYCNRTENYERWRGSVTQLNGALVGGETDIIVDSVLTNEVFESKTATSSAATTLTVSSAVWAASQWVNNYVYITSGVHSGKIRRITANTSTQITFDTPGSDPGNCSFEIRKLAFPTTGLIIYNGTTLVYTGMDTATSFQVTSAHAAPDNTPLTCIPNSYPGNPRGNRMTNYLGRVIVGRVRSAIARGTGGALQGFSSGGSYFVSKINDPFSFDFSATRVAGEGDIISTPYGGGEIEDVAHQEDTAYIFKRRYIESIKYSQDTNDLAQREPLKAETGSIGRVIKGSDDIYFVTPDNQIKSIGRVKSKDLLPATENIGESIKTVLDGYVFGVGKGIEHKDKLYIPARESSDQSVNNIVIVYNMNTRSFEGIWDISANYLEIFNGGNLYFGSSTGPNVYKALTGTSDVVSTTRYPIIARYASHFMNLTSSKSNLQALSSIYFEGYIVGDTTITFKAWKDFAPDPFLQFDFSATETGFLDGQDMPGHLGGSPMGIRPHGSVSSADEKGKRHFQFRVYFPFQYANYFSVGFESSRVDDNYKIVRYGLGLKESVSIDTGRVKDI